MKKIEINLRDFEESRKQMDEQTYGTTSIIGENDRGERIYVSISKESIVVETYQTNGWVRQDRLRHDGTREELYNRRWKTVSKTFTVTVEIAANDESDVYDAIEKLVLDERTISYKVEERDV